MAREKGLNFTFIQSDVLKVEIEECDMLFIDTYHCYNQLKSELDLHANKVKKYIAMHDTVSYATRDEGMAHWVTNEMKNNYRDEGKYGLILAINEFLEENKNWEIENVYTHNNGLMILKRTS